MNPWIAIVGTRADGRHDVLARLHRELTERNRRVAGFLQVPLEEAGERVGYDLVELNRGARVPFARESDAPRICNWAFAPEAFAAAHRWVVEEEADVSMLEVGRIEAAEDGHWPAVLSALRVPGRTVVLGIRPAVLASIALRLPDPVDALELPAGGAQISAFVDRLGRTVAR